MAWEGKRLQSLSGNNTTASYTYDEQGVRSSKTVNGVTTTFHYNGSLLMAQVQGSGSSQVKQLYSYDANGDVISVNYNGTEYYYLRNGQTDIVGLMDGSGTRVVEYTYDAWGKLISATGTLATLLGADNPYRYRGYYEVGSEVPLDATFGVPLSGDSMEPDYHNGDSVWIHQQQTLNDGEIGLFMLNGQAYVKKLESGRKGIRLISLNPAYPPMYVDAADSFRVLGKVVANTPGHEST